MIIPANSHPDAEPLSGFANKRPQRVSRLRFLDGLRGWGAVFVLLYHVFCDVVPVTAGSADFLRQLIPFNGGIAVMTFFLVSGFALSTKFLADGDYRTLVQIGAGRYFRLVIPILFACALVHLALVFGLIAPPAGRLPQLQPIVGFDPTLWHLLRFTLFDVFFNYDPADTYITPLWTMKIEFQGSFLVLAVVALALPLPGRPALLAITAACFLAFDSMFALFVSGIALADAFLRGWIDRLPPPVALAMIVISSMTVWLLDWSVVTWLHMVATIALTIGCIGYMPARKWLSGPVSRHLGIISFPLYLIHAPLLLMIAAPLTLNFGQSAGARLAIDLLTVLLSFVAAYAIVPANEYSIRISRRFGDLVVATLFRRPIAGAHPSAEWTLHRGIERNSDARS